MRRFATSDSHGCYKALKQCLERSGFNKEEDLLIHLGDICDGWSYVYECVEELLTIKNLISIRGNHDEFFRQWLISGIHPDCWEQGGFGTKCSYLEQCGKEVGYNDDLDPFDIPVTHHEFFKKQIPYYVDEDNNLFVHGGFNRHFLIDDPIYNKEEILMWDRDLWYQALSYKKIEEDDCYHRPKFRTKNEFKEIFIGHTSTINWKTDLPMNAANVWNVDTGCGYNGRLVFIDVDTKLIYPSDKVRDLYPNERGR